MSLFSVLNVATRGLSASQLGMDVSGQNISNADVEGYSRKRLNMAADYRYDSQFGQMGFGVEVINIERMRNSFIDEQIQRQTQDFGLYTEVDQALETIENIFTEPSDTGIMTFIDKFFDSWENLANNPADSAARTMVKTNGEILTDAFHNLSAQLRDFRFSRNDEIKNRVEKINELSLEIFNLNREIASIEMRNQNANDSRDRRDQLLKNLSEIIEINTSEDKYGNITLTTSGNILVSPVEVQLLELTTTAYTRPDGSSYSNVGVRFKESKEVYVPSNGQLRGLIDSRDTIVPEYEAWIDELALGITEKVNEQHRKGFNLQGYSGILFFDPDATGASDINLSASVISDIKNIAAAGVGSQQPAGLNIITAPTLNFGSPAVALSKVALTIPPAPTTDQRVRNIVQGTISVTADSQTGTQLIENVDYHIDYLSGTIQMLHNGYDGHNIYVTFDYSTENFGGPGNNANAIAIAQLRHNTTMENDPLGHPTATYDQFYSGVIGKLGLSRNEASSNLTTRQFLIDQYNAHQDSIAGVSLDEEMADLVKYQHTYQAAANVISTASKMLDVLLNL
ncbi:MAG: flagellar hook-associated protein FlgK [Chitinivibrionales bacterium]|nr:flagellar hook-associated protein FlgK [Chitinivibrionales bacterium]